MCHLGAIIIRQVRIYSFIRIWRRVRLSTRCCRWLQSTAASGQILTGVTSSRRLAVVRLGNVARQRQQPALLCRCCSLKQLHRCSSAAVQLAFSTWLSAPGALTCRERFASPRFGLQALPQRIRAFRFPGAHAPTLPAATDCILLRARSHPASSCRLHSF